MWKWKFQKAQQEKTSQPSLRNPTLIFIVIPFQEGFYLLDYIRCNKKFFLCTFMLFLLWHNKPDLNFPSFSVNQKNCALKSLSNEHRWVCLLSKPECVNKGVKRKISKTVTVLLYQWTAFAYKTYHVNWSFQQNYFFTVISLQM